MTTGVALVAAFVGLVVVLFVLGMIEASLLHLRRSEVAVAAEAGDHSARRVLRLVDELPRVLNAVLLAVLLAQVTATSIAGALASRWFGGFGLTAATIVVTFLLFVYGEAIPKTIAIRHPSSTARRLSVPIRWIDVVLRPFVAVLVKVAELQSPSGDDERSTVSEDELRHLTDEAASEGEIEVSDAELIDRSFAVDLIGFVHLRDLAEAVTAGADGVATDYLRPATTVAHDERVIDLLRTMQSSGNYLALVAADDGRTAGIATIEDAVTELVGTVDEHR